MKLIFSLFILFQSANVEARDIFLITYNGDRKEEAKLLKELMVKQQSIPRRFISLRKTRNPCTKKTDTILHYCFSSKEQKFVYRNQVAMMISIRHLQNEYLKIEEQRQREIK